VDPECVETTNSFEDSAADRACWRDVAGVAERLEEDVFIAFGERRVPGDFDAEALVLVGADGEVGAEEDGEIDILLKGDAAEQRRLVLDGVADEIGEAERFGRRATCVSRRMDNGFQL